MYICAFLDSSNLQIWVGLRPWGLVLRERAGKLKLLRVIMPACSKMSSVIVISRLLGLYA